VERIVLRAEKAQVIDDLHAVFASAGVVVVAHYGGMSVPEITELRGSVRRAGGAFRVTKNRLAKRALDGTPYASAGVLFKGPTALAWSRDPVAAPKAIVEFARKNDKLKLVGGGIGATVLDPDGVKALAELPSLEVVRAGLVGLLQAPAAKLVGLLQAPGGQVARALAARAEQGGDGGAAADAAGRG
jgi:large subunit ribosomal protein L10